MYIFSLTNKIYTYGQENQPHKNIIGKEQNPGFFSIFPKFMCLSMQFIYKTGISWIYDANGLLFQFYSRFSTLEKS